MILNKNKNNLHFVLLASISQEGFNIKWRVSQCLYNTKTSLKNCYQTKKKNSPNKAKKKNQIFFEIWRFLKAKKMEISRQNILFFVLICLILA